MAKCRRGKGKYPAIRSYPAEYRLRLEIERDEVWEENMARFDVGKQVIPSQDRYEFFVFEGI
jgi:hypothetical protein